MSGITDGGASPRWATLTCRASRRPWRMSIWHSGLSP